MPSLSPLIGLVSPGSRADDVAQRISEAVHLGLLDDGEQLPVEVDLARQFGVAPMTVREALAVLREQGLVVTRRGRSGGSFIQRPATPPVDALRATLAEMTVTQLRDLIDEHVGIAGQAARLAAERSSAVNVRRLFGLTEQLGSASTLGERIRADCRFHIELAIASQSERLTRHEVALQAEVSGLLWLPGDPAMDVGEIVAAHHDIAVAVVSEDSDKARQLTEEHVAGHLRRLTSLNLSLSDPGGSA